MAVKRSKTKKKATRTRRRPAPRQDPIGYIAIHDKQIPHPVGGADPDWVTSLAAPQDHAHDAAHTLSSVREAEYQGRQIRIETTYRITVNGEAFHGHCQVTNDGHLYTHSCPYREFSSAVDMMKHLVDLYPEAFEPRGLTEERPAVESETHEHHGHGHSH